MLKQPPPNFLAPYPAIKALNQLGIINFFQHSLKNHTTAFESIIKIVTRVGGSIFYIDEQEG